MNIAWIEDDQGSMETGAKILIRLLDEKNGTKLMDEFDDPNKDITPERLEKFFEEHTLCRLSWFQSYPSMRDALDRHCGQKWDVVIIDLNLEHGFGEVGKINPPEAGFALYIQLLRLGFSSEYIAFYTGNKGEVETLSENAEKMGIPPPESFDKGNEEELKKWLNAHLENKELILRRGILDGCKYLSLMVHEHEEDLRINQCAFDEDGKIEIEALSNWLQIWPKLLPELSNGSRVFDPYSPFLLTLLSLWDKKAKNIIPKNTTMAQSPLAQLDESDKNRGFAVIPYLLTHARNWSAHGQALHDASTEVVAFIFLLAGRGLIKRQAVPDRHEKIMLSLFPRCAGDVNATVIINKRSELKKTVRKLANNALKTIGRTDCNTKKIAVLENCRDGKVFFNGLANCYVNHSTNYAIENPSKLLMWSLLIDLAYISINGGEWKPEKWKGDNDWLEQLCFSLSAYLSRPEETVQ